MDNTGLMFAMDSDTNADKKNAKLKRIRTRVKSIIEFAEHGANAGDGPASHDCKDILTLCSIINTDLTSIIRGA